MHPTSIRRAVSHNAVVLSLCVASIATLSAVARADEPPSTAPLRPRLFGSRGQLVLDDLVAYRDGGSPGILGVSHSRSSFGDSSGNVTSFVVDSYSFDASADYFLLPRFSIGGRAGYAWSRTEVHVAGSTPTSADYASRSLTVVPRVGLAVPLSEEVTLYPRVGIGYRHFERESGGAVGGVSAQLSTGWLGAVEMPFVFRPGRSFFFRLGPELSFKWSPSGDSSLAAGDSSSRGVRFGGTAAFGLLLF
ncbi:MAG: outer membrane beta-barrel protein [Deltaproteobacteria bacterium]|nr:outer membrane beta-barrel protein [Deltaproteobacteria bacterium]